ncbi:trigger factor [candidate division TA06 bacterium]|uniref:Trigger factor n=1 Tax=candidate division TA06 bacterium TaxID=2250710 RepID=A0A933MIF7_UNCT6|nr:trigger factor [candidate division TA06 bacterium]
MKVELKEPKVWQRVFEIEVPGEQVKAAIEELYLDYSRNAKIPGFRPGKVPRTVLEARFGKGIEAEAIERLVPESYEKALVEHKIVPVNRAEISDLGFTPDRSIKFKAAFEVLPQVSIKQYKGLPAAKRLRKITGQDADREIEYLQGLYAEYKKSANPAKEGDRLMIDFVPVSGLENPERARGENYPVDLGMPRVLSEFNQSLIGAQAGQEKEIAVKYPDDYQGTGLAGKKAVFKVTVKEVREKLLPALDDEFAKKVSEYQTLAELKEKIKNGLEARSNAEAAEGVRVQVLQKMIEDNPLELPQSLVAGELDKMVADAKERHQQQYKHQDGHECQECPDDAKLKEQYLPIAEWKIKEDLLMAEVARQEKIEVSDAELDESFADLARYYRKTTEEIKATFSANQDRLDDLKDRIAVTKAGKLVAEAAAVKEEFI